MLAFTPLAAMLAVIVWLNIRWRREQARRLTLPLDEQEALKRSDEAWLQRYSF